MQEAKPSELSSGNAMHFIVVCTRALTFSSLLFVMQTPDGVLKLKKLKKLVLKALQESGIQEDETQLSNVIEHKVSLGKGQ